MSATPRISRNFASQVEAESRAGIGRCLQCQKCSSGCPVAGCTDPKPHALLRLVQLGQKDEALASRLIWACTSCHTCRERCPQSVDIGAMNDALRRLGTRKRAAVPTFNRLFLRSVRRRGRVFELGLMASFKLRTMRLFEDMGKLPMMLIKRKLTLLPGKGPRRGELDRIFARTGGRRP
jgi:heterodisulfide reductase subunit C2